MMEAIIDLNLPSNWIEDVVDKYQIVIKILNTKMVDQVEVRELVEIAVQREEEMAEVIESVLHNPNVKDVDISQIERGKALAAFTVEECEVCRLLAATDCFLTSSNTTEESRLRWSLLVTRRESLQTLIRNLESLDADPKLIKLSEISDKDALTVRQEQITRMAFEKGYFDFPRRIGLKELANSFDVSTSTLSEILRKGQRRIMSRYFLEHRHL